VYSHCYEGELANSKVSRKQDWNDRSWPLEDIQVWAKRGTVSEDISTSQRRRGKESY
jgi:hypothetical protein